MTAPYEPLDPYKTVLAAGVQVEVIPESTYVPDPTQGVPDPEPVTVPARVRFSLDVESLPATLKSPDGQRVDLAAIVALLWQVEHSREIRAVTGHVVLTAVPGGIGGSIWQQGRAIDFPVTWDQPAPTPPTGVLITTEAGVIGAGKTVAVEKIGTATTTGAVITATNVSGADLIVNSSVPIIYHAQGLYLHTPILDLEQ